MMLIHIMCISCLQYIKVLTAIKCFHSSICTFVIIVHVTTWQILLYSECHHSYCSSFSSNLYIHHVSTNVHILCFYNSVKNQELLNMFNIAEIVKCVHLFCWYRLLVIFTSSQWHCPPWGARIQRIMNLLTAGMDMYTDVALLGFHCCMY